MNEDALDPGIPVLTEIIPTEPLQSALLRGTEGLPRNDAAPDLQNAPSGSEDDWERLECEVREQLIIQVLDGLKPELEKRLQESMSGVLQNAVAGLAAQLQAGLHHTVQQAVAAAVAREMAKRQSS